MRVIEVNPEADPRWERFVAEHPQGTVYLHPKWLRALHEEYGQKTIHLACEDGHGKIVGVLPLICTRGLPFKLGGSLGTRRLSSLPRSPVGGPLAANHEAGELLVKAAIDRCREMRGMRLQLKTGARGTDGDYEGVVLMAWRVSYVLELPEQPSDLRFGNNVTRHRIKWAVNRAIKLGVEVREARIEKELRQWYSLYLNAMRRCVALPRPYRFFRSLWENLRPAGMLRLLLAEQARDQKSKLIAGSIFLSYGTTVSYAFTGCKQGDFAFHPNDLIHWTAIHDACRRGFKRYDFGEVAEERQQLANYKSKWGAVAEQLYRYYFPAPEKRGESLESETDRVRHAVAGAWQHLPLGVTAVIGDWAYGRL